MVLTDALTEFPLALYLRAILLITITEENRDVRSNTLDLTDFRVINTKNLER